MARSRKLSDWQVYSSAALRAIGPRTMAEGRRAMRQVAAMWRRRRNPADADSAQVRYQRAIGHGERLETAREAAANPGRATGRTTPNCPRCGALVRLPNPPRPTVTCSSCGQLSEVRRP